MEVQPSKVRKLMKSECINYMPLRIVSIWRINPIFS